MAHLDSERASSPFYHCDLVEGITPKTAGASGGVWGESFGWLESGGGVVKNFDKNTGTKLLWWLKFLESFMYFY